MNSATVLVLGGGVIGLSTAYHLARKKYGKVIVFDKGPVGDGSSSRAAGIITGLLWSEAGILARKKSLELFRELSHELGGYKFQAVGCLNFIPPKSWPDREKLLPLYQRLGVRFEILDAAEMRRRWFELYPRDEWVGLFDPLGGYSEPDEYIPALAEKDRELGVEIRECQQVVDFLMRGGRLAGVRTDEGDIEGDMVVSTVHSWTLKLLEKISLRLPIKSFVHQRYVTHSLRQAVRIPAVNADPLSGYVRPALGHRLLVGVEDLECPEFRVDSIDFRMSTLTSSEELKARASNDFTSLVPALRDASWETDRVGLLAFSMDGEPVLGPVRTLPGFLIGTAFHSGGFAYNPVAGLLLAEYIVDGHTSIDVSSFSPDRFEPQEVEAYLESTVLKKDRFRRRH